MLTTGDNRAPRARRSCYVREPAYGFFIAGSSIERMNGVYIRENVPEMVLEDYAAEAREPLLYYVHMDQESEWTMVLTESTDAVDEESSDEDDPLHYFGRPARAEPHRVWALADESDRFHHKGDTIVPGAGAPRWKHVHASTAAAGGAPPRAEPGASA